MNITIDRDGTRFGPYTLDQIQECLAKGTFNESDWAWYEGCTDWLPVRDVISLSTPPPIPPLPKSPLLPPTPILSVPKLPPLPPKVAAPFPSTPEEFLKLGPDGWARLLSESKQRNEDLEQKRAIEEKAQSEGEEAGRNAQMFDEGDDLNPYKDYVTEYPQPNPNLYWKLGFSSGWDESPNNTDEKINKIIEERIEAQRMKAGDPMVHPTEAASTMPPALTALPPPSDSPIANPLPLKQIYVLHNGERKGPYSDETVRQYLKQGSLLPNNLAWHDGLDGWVALSEIVARTNSLGMKFVPAGTDGVLFSIWDVRVKDFSAFVDATGYDATAGMISLGSDGPKARGDTWKSPGFGQTEKHPVVGVSWEDAKAFCQWLTRKEQTEGGLTTNQEYRLPTDAEWSKAVGLSEKSEGTPKNKYWQLDLFTYPWGGDWPPPTGAGNYAGSEAKDENWPSGSETLAGYNDGYPRTSPVGSFKANCYGLYDMGGNVWQWCGDRYDRQHGTRVQRGGSWFDASLGKLISACRGDDAPDSRITATGFRVVIGMNKQIENTWEKLNDPIPAPSGVMALMGKVSLPFLISILPDNLFFCDRASLNDVGVAVASRGDDPFPFVIALPMPGIVRFFAVQKFSVSTELINKINQDLVYCRCFRNSGNDLCFSADMLICDDTSSDSIIMFFLSCIASVGVALKGLEGNPQLLSAKPAKSVRKGCGCLSLFALIVLLLVLVALFRGAATNAQLSDSSSTVPSTTPNASELNSSDKSTSEMPSASPQAETAPPSSANSDSVTSNPISSVSKTPSDLVAKEPTRDTSIHLVSQSAKLTDLYRSASDNQQLIALYDDNTFSCDDPALARPKVYGTYDRLQYGGNPPGTGRSINFNSTFGPVSGEGVIYGSKLDFSGSGNGAIYTKIAPTASETQSVSPNANVLTPAIAPDADLAERNNSLNQFLTAWWRLNPSNDPNAWAQGFADSVDYCYEPSGPVAHDYLINDRSKLIRAFPIRVYSTNKASSTWLESSKAQVDIDYNVKCYKSQMDIKSKVVRAKLRLIIERDNSIWKITSYQETIPSN